MSIKHSIVGQSAGHVVQKKRTVFMQELLNSVEDLDTRVAGLEDTMRISGVQEYKIHEAGTVAVVKALGGKGTPAYKKLSRKTFASIWSEFKHYFNVPRYGELPAKQYKEGMDFVSTWQPKQELRMDIKELNAND